MQISAKSCGFGCWFQHSYADQNNAEFHIFLPVRMRLQTFASLRKIALHAKLKKNLHTSAWKSSSENIQICVTSWFLKFLRCPDALLWRQPQEDHLQVCGVTRLQTSDEKTRTRPWRPTAWSRSQILQYLPSCTGKQKSEFKFHSANFRIKQHKYAKFY